MNNHQVKDFMEKTKGAFKRVICKLTGKKTSATGNKVRESEGAAQPGHDALKDGVKKTT